MLKQSIIALFFFIFSSAMMNSRLQAQSLMRQVEEIMQVLGRGEQSQALRMVDKALEENPDAPELHFTRACCLANYFVNVEKSHFITDGELCDEIEAEMLLALDSPDADSYWYNEYGVLCYICMRYEHARNGYQKALELAQTRYDTVVAYMGLSHVEDHTGNYDQAIVFAEMALELEPTAIAIMNNLASLYMVKGRYDDAKMLFLRIDRISPDQPMVFANLGFICLELEEWEKAEAYYSRCLDVDPTNGYAFSNRSFAKMKLGRLKEALQDVNKGIEHFPSNSWAFKNRALIYLEMGKKKKACEDLLHAREMGYSRQYDSEVDDLIREHCD